MTLVDLLVAAAVLALAALVLFRSFRKGGGCAGCHQSGSCSRSPAKEGTDRGLVQLARPGLGTRRPGSGAVDAARRHRSTTC